MIYVGHQQTYVFNRRKLCDTRPRRPSRPARGPPPDTTSRVTERLTMTYTITRRRRPPPWPCRWSPACCSPPAGPATPAAAAARSRRRITFTYAPANAKDNSYEVLAKDYEAAHPGVTIKLNKINAEAVNSTLTTQMQAGNGPDVMALTAGSGQAAHGRPVRQGRSAPAADRPGVHTRHPRGRAGGLRRTTASSTASRARPRSPASSTTTTWPSRTASRSTATSTLDDVIAAVRHRAGEGPDRSSASPARSR